MRKAAGKYCTNPPTVEPLNGQIIPAEIEMHDLDEMD